MWLYTRPNIYNRESCYSKKKTQKTKTKKNSACQKNYGNIILSIHKLCYYQKKDDKIKKFAILLPRDLIVAI